MRENLEKAKGELRKLFGRDEDGSGKKTTKKKPAKKAPRKAPKKAARKAHKP
jgi:hypothetical protein